MIQIYETGFHDRPFRNGISEQRRLADVEWRQLAAL